MNWLDIISQGLSSFVGTVTPQVLIFLTALCFIGEGIGISIPYVLEATWLMTGYQLGNGNLKVPDFIMLLVVAQVGRLGGAYLMYVLGATGSALFKKYRKQIDSRFKTPPLPFNFLRRINLTSPFSIALGRLLWLRIPLTLVLAAQRKLKVLLLSVTISSLIYDGTYIVLGAIFGRTTTLRPINVLLISLGSLTLIYAIFFAIRRLKDMRRRQRMALAGCSNGNGNGSGNGQEENDTVRAMNEILKSPSVPAYKKGKTDKPG